MDDFYGVEEMRVLVVEDDKKIASFVVKGLKEAGFAVDCADNGEDGLRMALKAPYDAAVIDVMLPKLDGLSIIERLRTEKILTPLLILSAKRSVDDRVKGLQTGGDDYLTKPFSFSERLSMDLLTREVMRGETKLDLQPREFKLLEYLMRNPGRVVSKTMIIEHVWGYDFDPLTNIVDVLVSRLRHKVDRDFEKKLIQTHRGVGYALKIF